MVLVKVEQKTQNAVCGSANLLCQHLGKEKMEAMN